MDDMTAQQQAAERIGVTVEQYRYHYELRCRCSVADNDQWTFDPECFMGQRNPQNCLVTE